MSNVKISALPAAAALDGTELVPVVQGGSTVKALLINFAALFLPKTLLANTTISTGGHVLILDGILSTVGAAPTIASSATIAPTQPITFISGITQINTITPPATLSATGGQLTLIPTGIFLTGTSGNIAIASTSVVGKALIMTYDTTTTKWYPSY